MSFRTVNILCPTVILRPQDFNLNIQTSIQTDFYRMLLLAFSGGVAGFGAFRENPVLPFGPAPAIPPCRFVRELLSSKVTFIAPREVSRAKSDRTRNHKAGWNCTIV